MIGEGPIIDNLSLYYSLCVRTARLKASSTKIVVYKSLARALRGVCSSYYRAGPAQQIICLTVIGSSKGGDKGDECLVVSIRHDNHSDEKGTPSSSKRFNDSNTIDGMGMEWGVEHYPSDCFGQQAIIAISSNKGSYCYCSIGQHGSLCTSDLS